MIKLDPSLVLAAAQRKLILLRIFYWITSAISIGLAVQSCHAIFVALHPGFGWQFWALLFINILTLLASMKLSAEIVFVRRQIAHFCGNNSRPM